MTRVLILPGSLRGSAPDAALAGAAARELALLGHSVTQLSLADYTLPVHDGELDEGRGAPQAAVQLARQFAAHDAALLCTPDSHCGLPPLLKNALDWAGHPTIGGPAAFGEDRVFALAAASPNSDGGLAALLALRRVLEGGLGALVIPEQLALAAADTAFDDRGALADPERAAELRRLLEAMTRRARLLRRGLEG
jgi:chromate reductase